MNKLQRKRPHGKECTEVRITQNKGKESENSYRKLKSSRWTGTRTQTRKQNQNILTDTAVLNQKRANVCEHTTRMASLEFLRGATRGLREEWMEKRRLSEVNARAVSRGQNELVCKFKMAAGDMVSIRGQVMKYTYIPMGIKREMVRFSVDCDWKG